MHEDVRFVPAAKLARKVRGRLREDEALVRLVPASPEAHERDGFAER